MIARRWLCSALVAMVSLTSVAVVTSAGASAPARRKPQNPCKLLKLVEIEAQFGGPVERLPKDPINKDQCSYEVAPNATSSQGGTLYVTTLFPSHVSGTSGAADAIEAVENQRAFEAENTAQTVVDVPDVGAAAYLNDFTVTLTFARDARRAYQVQWADKDISSFGLTTPQPIVDRLRALALELVA